MRFSLLSWNVERFDGDTAQLTRVAEHIKTLDPDVFGLFEVENIDIIDLVTSHFPEYDFHLTDGPENKEILVGVRKGKFQQSTFSQKREFKVHNPYLRPGALLTLKLHDELYNVLFLHTDAGTEARDFGNRYEMDDKIWSLKKALDKLASAHSLDSRFIVLGDLNTMGLLYPTQRESTDRRISEAEEIEALETAAKRRNMVFLHKEFSTTFSDEKEEANLDHIFATNNISFKEFGQRDGEPFFVRVTGWQQLQGDEKKEFIRTISDHCSLYCEIK